MENLMIKNGTGIKYRRNNILLLQLKYNINFNLF